MRGITVTLYEKTETGEDSFGAPIYDETPVEVENVLVAPANEQEIAESINMTGRRAIYTMAIPKGDTHNWENVTVEFFGRKWRTLGMPIKGIEDLIPLSWNTKVRVMRYE